MNCPVYPLFPVLLLSSLARNGRPHRYLETWRSYDTKGAEGIQGRVGENYAARLNASLSSIDGINLADFTILSFTFGSLKGVKW